MNTADLQRAKEYNAAVEIAPERYAFFAETMQRWYVSRDADALESFGRAINLRLSPPTFFGAWESLLRACIQMPQDWTPADGLTPSLLGDDTLSDGFAKDLAGNSKDLVAQLLREPVNGNDEVMLAHIDETIENALRAKSIVEARVEAKTLQPLPFGQAA